MASASTLTSGGGSANCDPISQPQSWDYITIAGQQSPGLLKEIDGFERDNGWQEKKGKGSIGATLTYVQKPPAHGHLVFELWTSQHFQQWATFRQLFLYNPAAGQSADSQSFSISHPSLDDVQLSAVVCKLITPIKHVGKGKYRVKVELIEFIPTPKVSAVQTITLTNPNPKSTMPAAGLVPQTTLQKLKSAQAALLQQLQNSP
jgi:hypothetical protein